MKLSEAVRLAGMDHPQAKNHYITHDGRTCALGGAYMMSGGNVEELEAQAFLGIGNVIKMLSEFFPIVSQPLPSELIPAWPYQYNGALGQPPDLPWTVLSAVIWLNDHYGYTRQQIADWLETIETHFGSKQEELKDVCETVRR